jgi:CDP-diacylglycerol--glycerol-3-phosphate 3-phosphatidyltransferase
MTGALAPLLGVERRYAGPFGKSDRAIGFGLLALLLGLGLQPGEWTKLYLDILFALGVVTIINRARSIVANAKFKAPL